ncbi:MAG: right-handed parallel beta-helix repeat-containing protein, partial [Candidatus Omnitrophica bacterium]|nr:right-handed parallel beta-helix repeat-containing protein [Candidatus Omnitrophota bacterium]
MKKRIISCVIRFSLVFAVTGILFLQGYSHASEDAGKNSPREVWVGLRDDGSSGTGAITDPFDGSSVEKLNSLFDKFSEEYGDNITIHFGPGIFEGDKWWVPKNNWKIRGAGMDITIFRTRANPDATRTVGFRAGGYTDGVSGFELSDVTFDFNTPNLRKANRIFTYPVGNTTQFSYFYAKDLPEWKADADYKQGNAVIYKGVEYMAITVSKNQAPAKGQYWSVLHPCQPDKLPVWNSENTYGIGDAVSKDGKCFLSLVADAKSEPRVNFQEWLLIRADAPDPFIYTHAAFIHVPPPGGRNRVSRVRAINGNGSAFFGLEDFVIGLGGNDCVIENCIVEDFQGDYGTLIVMNFGQHGVVRGCTVRGNDSYMLLAYGGWACYDTVFEDNFCTNVRSASNIDSLTCRNVTFRDNVFMNCRETGILVNVYGGPNAGHESYSMPIDGKVVNIGYATMDGLFVYNNLIQMRDNAPYAGVQMQTDGLSNVKVYNNIFRTTSGGRSIAVGVYGNVKNITVYG